MIFLYRIIINIFLSFFVFINFFKKIFKKEDPKRYKEKIFSNILILKEIKKKNLFGFMLLVLVN